MEGITITDVRVTSNTASEVLETVLSAGHTFGIGYWGAISNVRKKKDRVVSFTVTENEGHKKTPPLTRRVTTADIRPAILEMLQTAAKNECRAHAKQLLFDDLDGPVADTIIQFVCFNEVRYC